MLDPRARLIVAAVYMLAVAAVPRADWYRLAGLFGFVTIGFAALGVPARVAFRRLAPLLGLVAAAVLGILVSCSGGTGAGASVSILDLTARLMLISASAVVVTASTAPGQLLGAMRAFRTPPTVVSVMLLTSRYLHVLQEEMVRSVRAWRSRMVGSMRWRHAVALGRVAVSLARRAVERADRIAWAMVARGFDGALPCAPLPPIRLADALAATIISLALIGIAAGRIR